MRYRILFIICFVLGLLFAAADLRAQTAAPTPTDGSSTFGGFEVTSSIEFGVRGLVFNGSDDKFRSDLNYRPGFRIWDSSFTIKPKSGKGEFFDNLQIKASGFGADPSGYFRLGMDKGGAYKLDANVRRVNLINRVNNLTLGFHRSNAKRNFGDFDLTIFPASEKLRFRFGFSFNKAGGNRGASYRTRDVFPIREDVDSNAWDVRPGIDTKLAGFKLTFTVGHRRFRDRGRFLVESRQTGVAGSIFFGIPISPTDVNFLNRMERSNPTDSDSTFGSFTMQRTFAKRVDLTGRFIYSETKTSFNISDNIGYDGQIRLPTGVTSPNLFVDSDIYSIFGASKRYQARGDIGLTWAATDNVRFSNTFLFEQFTSFGDTDFNQLTSARVQSTGLPYLPSGVTVLDVRALYWRQHNFKRFMNTVEGDFQINNRVGFFVGYRFTHRAVGIGTRNATVNDLLNRTLFPVFGVDEEENTAHTVIYGTKIKPTSNWSIFADGEYGQADNAFIRLANQDYTNFRARSMWNVKKFTFNLSGIIRNNENPSRTADYRNSSGVITLPAFDIIANTRSRVFSAYVDYVPDPRWTLSWGYTHSYLSSKTDTVVPLSLSATGPPPNPNPNLGFIRGFSEFFMKDNYLFVDLSGQPMDRVSFYASYRYNRDKGQGIRAATTEDRFLSSYPFTSHTPEIRIAIKLTKNIDWNLGYQYNSYKERLQFGYIPYNQLSNTNVIPANAVYPSNQNYNAHLPYTSLRIYFGGRD